MNERDRALIAEFLRRKRAERTGFAHGYVVEEPTPKQRAFIDDDSLELLFGGAAGGGKSSAILASALKFVHVPGYSALLLRKSYTDLALPGAIMDRSHKWLSGTDAHWNGIDKRWTFPSGAKLQFGYLESDADKYRYQGAELQMVGIDEVTQWREDSYTYLFSRLRSAGVKAPLRFRGATNPGGIGHKWVKRRFKIPDVVDPTQVYEGEDGAKFYPSLLTDNPHVDRDAYELSLSKLTNADRAQLKDGRWIQDASMLVAAFDPTRNLVQALPKLPPGATWRRVLGIDYGNVDATALVALAFNTRFSDNVWIERSQKWSELDPDGAAEVVRAWASDLGGFERMVGDTGGLGKGYVEQARRRFALPIEAAEKSDKLGSIKLLNGAMERGRILVVEPQNESLVAELEELRWRDERKLEILPGSEDHAFHAMLYGWKETTAWMHRKPDQGPQKGTKEFYDKIDREAEKAEAEALKRESEEDW